MSPISPQTIKTTREDEPLKLLSQMLLIRRFEEKAAELYTESKIRGFLHLYIGEEAVAAGVMSSLTPEDNIVATYREHGHALARGLSPGAIMAEMYGKQEGVSHGRGGSMHLFDRQNRFFGGNAIVGGGLPLAVGLALADKMRRRHAVTACFFGEGAMAEGEFHESMNLAALWNVPVLFCCENNLYAMGTHLDRSESQIDLCRKANSYNMEAESVDGMNVKAVAAAGLRLAEAVRLEGKPRFVEFKTYRFRAHSMYDPELYRVKSEVDEWKKHDPIQNFIRELQASGGITKENLDQLEEEISRKVASAVAFAESGTWEPVENLLRDVTSA